MSVFVIIFEISEATFIIVFTIVWKPKNLTFIIMANEKKKHIL